MNDQELIRGGVSGSGKGGLNSFCGGLPNKLHTKCLALTEHLKKVKCRSTGFDCWGEDGDH
jgi:hypothetical protein